MKIPRPAHGGKLSKQDEEVFAQAKELASLRLEQCLADRQLSVASITHRPSTMQHRTGVGTCAGIEGTWKADRDLFTKPAPACERCRTSGTKAHLVQTLRGANPFPETDKSFQVTDCCNQALSLIDRKLALTKQ